MSALVAEVWELYLTATHIMENLATELYASAGDCLWELVRNAVCACMPGDDWVPGVGDVEIFLVDNHPLSPKRKALVILDHGHGFTNEAIKLYCMVGSSLEDRKRSPRGSNKGAAQKRIGRFSGLACNKACAEDHDPESGFFILTRTAASGPVKFVTMIPGEIERNRGRLTPQILGPTDLELGPQRGIKGSFTAIVIPNSVFSTHDEIRRALEWRIPRKPKQMFKLLVGGKALTPPPLASRVSISQQNGGRIEAFIDRQDDEKAPGGIWLVDADTGLRVTHAPRLGPLAMPYPLWRHDLRGDIFIPDLLANQDTARAGLTSSFLKSQAWHRATAYLISQVVGPAKALLKDEDVFGKDLVDTLLQDFVDLCNETYGVPEATVGPVCAVPQKTPSPPRPPSPATPATTRPHGDNGGGNHKNGDGLSHRIKPVQIGNETYFLSKRLMNSRVFAAVDNLNGTVIYLNNGGYAVMPHNKFAQKEHCLLKILEAVGQHHHPDNPSDVALFVADRLMECKKR